MTLQTRQSALRGGASGVANAQRGGSCINVSTTDSFRPLTRSFSLETILDDSGQNTFFQSTESLASSLSNLKNEGSSLTTPSNCSDLTCNSAPCTSESALEVHSRRRLSLGSMKGFRSAQRMRSLRPRSVGSCLDIVVETAEEEAKESRFSTRAASCLNVNTPATQQAPSLLPSCPAFTSGSYIATGPRSASSTSNLQTPQALSAPRRCISSLDVSKLSRPQSLFKQPVCEPASQSQPPQSKSENSKTLYLSLLEFV